jgi:hypothetical protein
MPPVKARDEILGGAYANSMFVAHTREEFVMDFLYMSPSQAVLNARVITSPGHMKRIIRALSENLRRYEEQHGQIQEATEPKKGKSVVN